MDGPEEKSPAWVEAKLGHPVSNFLHSVIVVGDARYGLRRWDDFREQLGSFDNQGGRFSTPRPGEDGRVSSFSDRFFLRGV
jgi:hypothetical protein